MIRATTRYRVVLRLSPSHDLWASAQALSGLVDLSGKGIVAFSTRVDAPPSDPRHGSLVWLDATELRSGATRALVIDLADQANAFSNVGLREASAYFKRHYSVEAVEQLPAEARSKLRPFGLWLPCLSRPAVPAFLAASFRMVLQKGLSVEAATQFARNVSLCYALPSPGAFLVDPARPRAELVVFQTRVWRPDQNAVAPDVDKVNAERAEMVRSLRRAFGKRFVGGIVANAFSRHFCPDVVITSGTSPRAYSRLTRRALVGVFTRGLHDTLGFRLPEYLAAGLAIVTEPVPDVLLAPLEDGRHYRAYHSIEQCVSQCEFLLTHPEQAAEMRRANVHYFRQFCTPERQLLHVLAAPFPAAH